MESCVIVRTDFGHVGDFIQHPVWMYLDFITMSRFNQFSSIIGQEYQWMFFGKLNTFKIEPVLVKTCSIAMFLLISDRKAQTG